MCLIVAKYKKNSSFSVQNFRNSFFSNSDGMGIMYPEKGRVVVKKVLGSLKEQLELYYENMHRPVFVLHHRKRTDGERSLENVHPFKVLSKDDGDPIDLFMCHNGMFQSSKFSKEADKVKYSDTNLFVQEYMSPLLKKYPTMLNEPQFQIMLHEFIGYNKLTFLDNEGNIKIFNKQAGEEVDGCWLSNKGSIAEPYKAPKHSYPYNDAKAYENGYSHYVGGNRGNYSNFDYDDNEHWRKEWEDACKAEEANDNEYQKPELMSNLDLDTLAELIDDFSKLKLKEIEGKLKDDPFLCYDMVNYLNEDGVTEAFLDMAPQLAADSLYVLLQRYVTLKDQKAA